MADALAKAIINYRDNRNASFQNTSFAEESNKVEKSNKLNEQWKTEIVNVKDLSSNKEMLEKFKSELEESKRNGDLQRAGELTYSVIPKLEMEIKEAEKRSLNAKQINPERVSEDHIANVVAKWSGIPVEKLLGSEKSKLMDMEELLSQTVIGQKEAVESVSKAIRRAKAGLSDLKRPLASFLFFESSLTTSSPFPSSSLKSTTANAVGEFLAIFRPSATDFASFT